VPLRFNSSRKSTLGILKGTNKHKGFNTFTSTPILITADNIIRATIRDQRQPLPIINEGSGRHRSQIILILSF